MDCETEQVNNPTAATTEGGDNEKILPTDVKTEDTKNTVINSNTSTLNNNNNNNSSSTENNSLNSSSSNKTIQKIIFEENSNPPYRTYCRYLFR